MTAQIKTRTVSPRGVVASAAFRQGYEDAIAGNPWRDLDNMKGNKKKAATDTMWAYERGRYFYHYLRGAGHPAVPLKDSRGRVRGDVMAVFGAAIREKAIT